VSHEATLRLAFASTDEAREMADAIAPENEGFVSTRIEGTVLVVEARAQTPIGLLRTLDDVLVCLQGAQRAARIGHG
jgi:hypothetical protein